MHRIALIIFGTLLLQGCAENRNAEVSTKTNYEVRTETISNEPINHSEHSVAVVPATTPVRKQARYHAKPWASKKPVMRNDEVSTGRAAPVIQAQEVATRDKTYNELQFSDSVNDYPLSAESIRLEMETYK